MKFIVLSRAGKKPGLFLLEQRIAAVQAMEALVRADGNVADARGNPAVRSFIEGGDSTLTWGGCRLDIVEVA